MEVKRIQQCLINRILTKCYDRNNNQNKLFDQENSLISHANWPISAILRTQNSLILPGIIRLNTSNVLNSNFTFLSLSYVNLLVTQLKQVSVA